MILRCAALVPRPDTLLRDVDLRIEGGRVVALQCPQGPLDPLAPVLADDCVVLPGLCNAHVHLELTGLAGSLPRGRGFLPWLEAMMVERGRLGEPELRLGVRRGIRECLRSGTTAVGDISSTGISGKILCGSPLRGVVFEEAIALDPGSAEVVVSEVRRRMQETEDQRRPGLRAGLSPHAPYSVSPSLLGMLVALRDAESRPLAMHLSESEEEITHVESGRGPLHEFLVSRGLLPLGAAGHGLSPVAFAAAAGVLRGGALLVHLNHLTSADLDLLAGHRHEITAVFCPRSHEFFGHAPHPLPDLLRRGIRVALGTDGRSSNDALCMFREMARVREVARDLPASAILGLATVSGAMALGLGGDAGSLEPGRYADLTARVLPLPVRLASDDQILEFLVSGETEPRLTMVGGQVVSGDTGPVDCPERRC